MASEIPVKQGKINLGKGKNKRKKNYAKLFKASDTGLARLEIYDDAKSSTRGVTSELIVCGDIVRVITDYQGSTKSEFLFALLTKDNLLYVFGVESDGMRHEWVKECGTILFAGHQKNSHSKRSSTRHNTITDNDIYDSAEEYIRDHRVQVSPETSQRLHVQQGYMNLHVESGNITIISLEGVLVGRWGIEHLRRFGYSDNDFHFEAGRKSELGPGLFSFITHKGKSIHAMVSREKQLCRENRISRMPSGETEPPGASAVQDQRPDYDGFTYEEITVTQQPAHRPNKSVAPSKPTRNVPAGPSTQSPSVKGKDQRIYGNVQEGMEDNNGGAIAGSMLYSEVTHPQKAWQNHGMMDVDDQDQIYETSDDVYEYDSLNRTTPANTEGDDLYSISSNQNPMSVQTQKDVPIEQLYAVVNKPKK
ncbi:unnamed protein product [Meganyctiphanes norvegica]|uniref:IRS-type PTB domain-containing protein n=1 Tax=Meganyctiphanes norvegica TaxID=48144 RepID=A0AAV2QHB4_MEGNR